MPKRFTLCVVFAVSMISGCAVAYKPIPLDATFWQNQGAVVGVASEKIPEADTVMLGAQGLLDYAINSANAANLRTHLKKIDLKRASAIPQNLADRINSRGMKAVKLEEAIDPGAFPKLKPDSTPELYAPRDFQNLKSKGIDRLLLVTVERLGTVRSYYGFIPLGPPQVVFTVKGQLVDLGSNKLLWYNRYDTLAAVPDPWDQSPEFPNVTAAFLKNIDDVSTQMERSFFATEATASAQ